MERARVLEEPYEVDSRLAALGFPDRARFEDAVRQGEFQRRNATPDDVPQFVGGYAYNRRLRALRASGGGWKADDRPIPCIIKGNVRISVARGDEHTGRISVSDPVTSMRGPETEKLIGRYYGPTLLDPDGTSGERTSWLWYLLTFVGADGVRAEVSCARGVDSKKRISTWHERIIFGVVDLGGGGRRDATPKSPAPDVDVPIVRRQTA